MEVGPAMVGVGLDRVRQFGSPEVKEKQQTRGEANASKEGDHRIKRTDCTVHVSIDVSSDHQYGDLSDEETNHHQANH